MENRVAYQGIVGSFSSMAARALYGQDFAPIQTARFRDIFEAVKLGNANFGVIPIENALAGSVHENYDLLQEYELSIVAEYLCPVHLHLMGHGSLTTITRVLSHPKALEQCSHFLELHPTITAVVCSDTAGAAFQVARIKDPYSAAIASEEASVTYRLPIIQRTIQNHVTNATRFVAIASKAADCPSPTKSSIVVSLPHEPGSLHKLLSEIASLSLNLTKIESRPILGKPFEYAFHIDLECGEGASARLLEGLARIERYAATYRLLGLYEARSGS